MFSPMVWEGPKLCVFLFEPGSEIATFGMNTVFLFRQIAHRLTRTHAHSILTVWQAEECPSTGALRAEYHTLKKKRSMKADCCVNVNAIFYHYLIKSFSTPNKPL